MYEEQEPTLEGLEGLYPLIDLAFKQQTRLERLAKDKHSSFLQIFVNYGQKSFITLAPG
jgi:hypothetical protein